MGLVNVFLECVLAIRLGIFNPGCQGGRVTDLKLDQNDDCEAMENMKNEVSFLTYKTLLS